METLVVYREPTLPLALTRSYRTAYRSITIPTGILNNNAPSRSHPLTLVDSAGLKYSMELTIFLHRSKLDSVGMVFPLVLDDTVAHEQLRNFNGCRRCEQRVHSITGRLTSLAAAILATIQGPT
jgi:hypothetical protein